MDTVIYLVKWVLIGMGFFSMGVSAVVFYHFSRVVYYAGRPGFLPVHVALVSLSYNILLGLAITARISELGEPLTRWPFFATATITGFVAMMIIARHLYRYPEPKHDA